MRRYGEGEGKANEITNGFKCWAQRVLVGGVRLVVVVRVYDTFQVGDTCDQVVEVGFHTGEDVC